jgi:adenosylmethionine-8-amino-7-oxononanoate aminotransferase
MDESGKPWMHAYTYSSHPVGCAVALAMLDIIEREDFPAQAAAKGKRLLVGLKDALSGHANVGDVRGLGLMCAVEIVEDRASKAEFDPAQNIGGRIGAAMVQRGMFTRMRGDVITLAPPIITPDDEIDRIVDITAGAVQEVLGG